MIIERIAGPIARVIAEGDELVLNDAQSALDLIGNAWQLEGVTRLIVKKQDVGEAFFDLKTGILGEIVQKFVNYNFRLAIVGDFSVYTSKSLRDFIYESNKGQVAYFAQTEEEAVAHLSK